MRAIKPLLCLILMLPLAALAEEHEAGSPAPEAQPQRFVSEHEIRVQGQRVRYRATLGTLIMRDEDGKPIAEFGYTAYEKEGENKATRPVMFAWNGGPGSASMWLHMGVLGPQITLVEDLAVNGKGPFRRQDNEYSIIDKVDLVMMDPVVSVTTCSPAIASASTV